MCVREQRDGERRVCVCVLWWCDERERERGVCEEKRESVGVWCRPGGGGERERECVSVVVHACVRVYFCACARTRARVCV